MASINLHTSRRTLRCTMIVLITLCVTLVTIAFHGSNILSVQGILIKQPKTYPWVVISTEQVMSGATIPSDSHVIFHLPSNFTRITRETLFGQKGKKVRYWGYCFPVNYDPKNVSSRTGFPGLIFLSEKERLAQEQAAALAKPRFTTSRLPTAEEVADLAKPSENPIRHQLEVFKPDTLCYIMTEQNLAIGLDPDNDRLNDKLEGELGTDPLYPDTDGDGILDGIEYMTGTIPSIRDSDGDGIIDGLEDTNWNGRINIGETDPRNIDSDRDGLCDGICRVKLQRQYVYLGEDKNLNGIVDENETDPRKWDSDGDGANDEVEVLECIAQGKEQCP